jgi:hypothetical protein
MSIIRQVRDSLNRSISEYEQLLDHRGLDDYTPLAEFILRTMRKAGEWRACSVHFLADGREVGSASLV